jgi:hypothetical protein
LFVPVSKAEVRLSEVAGFAKMICVRLSALLYARLLLRLLPEVGHVPLAFESQVRREVASYV